VRKKWGFPVFPADLPAYEHTLAELRLALGDKAFDTLWEEGGKLTMRDAVELAFSEPATPVNPDASTSRQTKEYFGRLTARERQVAALIAKGMSNREIAETMVLGKRTVETYVSRILHKLSFDSRVQIATWAVEKGLSPPSVKNL
jgi:non-specific serine/threonine protein kinase